MFKTNLNYIVQPLTHLVNLRFETEVFSSSLKYQKIMQLFKSGDLKDPGNYRPIPVAPTISKLLRK